MKILLTGFGPFKGFDINPSAFLVEGFEMDNIIIRKEIFSVNREDIENRYSTILNEFQPDFILNIGLSANTGGLTLETFAINSLKDQRQFSAVGNELGYQTQINTSLLADSLCKKGIPSHRSDYAGSYYCNFIYFLSLEWCKRNNGNALFLHIPFTRKLACEISLEKRIMYPSLPVNLMQEGLHEIINFVRANRQIS